MFGAPFRSDSFGKFGVHVGGLIIVGRLSGGPRTLRGVGWRDPLD
jgi:hypothetical protein